MTSQTSNFNSLNFFLNFEENVRDGDLPRNSIINNQSTSPSITNLLYSIWWDSRNYLLGTCYLQQQTGITDITCDYSLVDRAGSQCARASATLQNATSPLVHTQEGSQRTKLPSSKPRVEMHLS